MLKHLSEESLLFELADEDDVHYIVKQVSKARSVPFDPPRWRTMKECHLLLVCIHEASSLRSLR